LVPDTPINRSNIWIQYDCSKKYTVPDTQQNGYNI
jgi:hypothetical protein